jgi:hypothetical protein
MADATGRAAEALLSIGHNDITFGKPIVKIIGSNCRSAPFSADLAKADKVRPLKKLVRPVRIPVRNGP